MEDGILGLVAGWGLTRDGSVSALLQKLELPTVNYHTCRKEANTYEPYVTDDKICAGFKREKGVCQGRISN